MTSSVPERPLRRSFLMQVVGATSSLPLVALTGASALAATGTLAAPAPALAPAAPFTGYTSFSQEESGFVETLVNIMCPADGITPNGVDCGLATYMDRQLSGEFGKGARRYTQGPWAEGKPQYGYQLPMTPEQYFKAGIAAANEACLARFGSAFDLITPAQAAVFLDDLGAGKVTDPRLPLPAWFNDLVYPLFSQACFADPVYGGNHNKVFWKLIGYPGLPSTHTVNMVQYRGKPFPGRLDPKSMVDFS